MAAISLTAFSNASSSMKSFFIDWSSIFLSSLTVYRHIDKLVCGTWYHHPRRLQCVKFSKSQHSYNYFLHFSFCFILIIPRLTELWPFKCQGHPLSLWCWPLICNLEKCFSLRSSFGMYNLERQLWYLHLLTGHCPCNLHPEPTSPKHGYREKLWGHPVASSMTSSPWKRTFLA